MSIDRSIRLTIAGYRFLHAPTLRKTVVGLAEEHLERSCGEVATTTHLPLAEWEKRKSFRCFCNIIRRLVTHDHIYDRPLICHLFAERQLLRQIASYYAVDDRNQWQFPGFLEFQEMHQILERKSGSDPELLERVNRVSREWFNSTSHTIHGYGNLIGVCRTAVLRRQPRRVRKLAGKVLEDFDGLVLDSFRRHQVVHHGTFISTIPLERLVEANTF